jgi:type I restriction enzyme, S subunit
MEIKAGYKQTEVGIIPDDWKVTTIGNVADTSSGTTPSRSMMERYYNNGTIAWVKTLDLNNSEISSTEENVTQTAINETSLKIYPVGTVLVAMYGGFNQIGRTGLLCSIPATINQALTAIKPNVKVLFSQYLLRVLNYRVHYWKTVASSSRKDPNITGKDVRDFPLVLPQVEEQEAIAEALSDADALIEALEQLIAKKRQVKQGSMQELLTERRRLPGFSGEWKETSLGELGKIHRGVSYNPSRDLYPFDTNSTVRLLRSNNIQEAIVVFSDMQYVDASRVSANQIMRQDDVLICMANGSKNLVGKAGRFQNEDGYEYTFGAFMGCFRPDTQAVNPDFAFCLFLTEQYRIHISILLAGSSINNLTPTNVEAFVIRIPTDVKEQTAIAEILSDMDAEIAALEEKLSKARQVKQGMMQELLTGRVRLV